MRLLIIALGVLLVAIALSHPTDWWGALPFAEAIYQEPTIIQRSQP